jgi:hypothetical protein
MRNAGVITVIALLVFLSACGNRQMDAKPLRAVETPVEQPAAVPEPAAAPADESSGQTAAEAIKELQEQMASAPAQTGAQAKTLYPPAPAGVTGEEALKARTRSLYSQSTGVTGSVTADADFGSRFEDLPDDYANDGSAGE